MERASEACQDLTEGFALDHCRLIMKVMNGNGDDCSFDEMQEKVREKFISYVKRGLLQTA